MKCDVAIIGGGPAGSTVGSLLKAQNPELDVVIFESARFPRDHVGESLLPATCAVLQEIGVWDKVESAGFPVKLGGLYRWGVTDEVYNLSFLRGDCYADEPRPATYKGQRALTAFQVDRSIFDNILLEHASSLGCKVFSDVPVERVDREDDRVLGLELGGAIGKGIRVEADVYVDSSGSRGILRKAMGIGVEAPSALRNIAIYDYWQNADWGTRAGADGTHIHVMSIDWGWLWFIVLGETRTSVGLVTSAEHYKKTGLSTEELYLKAIAAEPLISRLLESAERENRLKAESDWSYIAGRLVGENWFLAGDSAGFADPILSAGLTLAMTGARKVAYSIAEMNRGSLDPSWVKSEYDRVQRGNIREHIRFADYWYSINAKFSDLKEYCAEIARDSGLNLDADEAFRWLGSGGFAGDAGGFESPSAATFRLSTVKSMVSTLGGVSPGWGFFCHDQIRLHLEGADREICATYYKGRVVPQQSFRRGTSRFFLEGFYKQAYTALLVEKHPPAVAERMFRYLRKKSTLPDDALKTLVFEVLEALYLSGWIEPIPA